MKHDCQQFSISDYQDDPYIWTLLSKGKFGLEKEHARVDQDGKLALTPHPSALGNKAEHPFITTDFSESQLEMITPPMESVEQAYGFLKTLHKIVLKGLPEGEDLWLQSMPPELPDEDLIPLAQFEGKAFDKTLYREYLSSVYGKSRQMISGSHFNFSFTDDFFEYVKSRSNAAEDLNQVRGQVYLKLVRNLMRHRWLLVGLLGRSPRSHSSLKLKALGSKDLMAICQEFGVSIRSSKIGYRNPHPLLTDYSCIDAYNHAIDEHLRTGKLISRNELYLPVRIKSSESGEVSHIEIRLLDLDPFDSIGLDLRSLKLLHFFIIYCLLEDDSGSFDSEDQEMADNWQNSTACCGFVSTSECNDCSSIDGTSIRDSATSFFEEMQRVVGAKLIEKCGFKDVISWSLDIIGNPQKHPANQIIHGVGKDGFIAFHLNRQKVSRDALGGEDFRFHGMEDLELSTQLLLREAVKRGVNFDVLDRNENFVRLHRLGKQEYVMQATRTSLDQYSHILLMENKLVTKEVLDRVGIRTPKGQRFESPADAELHWNIISNQPIVIKPKSTNFGLGITILKNNSNFEIYKKAVAMAFEHDKEILIEEFVLGKEYRFFLIAEQVVGVLRRVPANVIGDGHHTIRELVFDKNKDPLRGKGYRTPLEKIELGEPEAMFLAEQDYDFNTIPDMDEVVYLRENSNISTGGDSIDFTDRVHRSYFEIASAAAKALKVNITGLDMMIEDVSNPASHDNYAIIEMNFNPAIHIHCFPYEGENRRIDESLLNQLGFV